METRVRLITSSHWCYPDAIIKRKMFDSNNISADRTVQITFNVIGQTHLVFGKRVCTCVTKHSNAFRTFLNWLKNSKRVLHEPTLHISRLPLFANFESWMACIIRQSLQNMAQIRYSIKYVGLIHYSVNPIQARQYKPIQRGFETGMPP